MPSFYEEMYALVLTKTGRGSVGATYEGLRCVGGFHNMRNNFIDCGINSELVWIFETRTIACIRKLWIRKPQTHKMEELFKVGVY